MSQGKPQQSTNPANLPADPSLILDDRIREESERHWAAVHEAAGIKVSGQSLEWTLGMPRQHGRGQTAATHPVIALASDGAKPGDLVVQWDGYGPTRSNQYVRRIDEIVPSQASETEVGLILGDIVPRSEWPEALREATAPTSVYSEQRFDGDVGHVSVKDGQGKEIFAYSDASDLAEVRMGYLDGAIEEAATLGREDATGGIERRFDIRKGSGGPAKDRSYWQLVSDAGTVVDVERRGVMAFRPSKFVEAVLVATRAAYADGLKETLDLKAARDSEASAPRM